ncbi:MAG: hypothetical protein L6Q78_15885 [Bacteroidia bacterium]|nr:hypothetical protein [Bacteroidia bacterium]
MAKIFQKPFAVEGACLRCKANTRQNPCLPFRACFALAHKAYPKRTSQEGRPHSPTHGFCRHALPTAKIRSRFKIGSLAKKDNLHHMNSFNLHSPLDKNSCQSGFFIENLAHILLFEHANNQN